MTLSFSSILLYACITVGITIADRTHAAASTGEVTTLSVTNPRPIWFALQQLSKDHGYALTYEDPLYLYEEDMEDVTDQVRRQTYKPGQPRIVNPKNGSLTIEYEMSTDGKPMDILEVVGKLVQADSKRIGDRFTFFQDGEFIHVVPTRTRDAVGQWMSRGSVLDAIITIPFNQRSVGDLFDAICQALSKTSGVPVRAGTYPLNAFIKTRTNQGADKEVARDVVVRMLRTFKQKLTWSLNYDPMMKNYIFNVAVAGDPVSGVKGPIPAPPNTNNELTPMGPRSKKAQD